MILRHFCTASIAAVALGITRLVTATMATALALCWAQPANAQQADLPFAIKYTGTLKQIKDSGVVRIGYRENSPPFAFLDKNRKPIGYSLDLCEIVVEEIVAELGKDVRTEYRPVTPENRFDLVTLWPDRSRMRFDDE